MNASCTGVSLIGRVKSLDGGHVGAVDERRKIETAGHRAPVDQHGAAAAQSLAAGFARAGEAELRLQELDQIVVRLDAAP